MSLRVISLAFAVCVVGCAPQTFDESECPFQLDASQVQGETVRCGYLLAKGSQPKSVTIKVPVLAFLGESRINPIVYLSGGPGQSWADLGLEQITAADSTDYPSDIVFVEQRGSGLSIPRLDCDEFADHEVTQALSLCAERLQTQGVFPEDFNTQTLADDVEAMRVALKYDKLVLDGTSYGTSWALEIMRRFGEHLESVVLDSVSPPQVSSYENFILARNTAFTALFNDCVSDFKCTANYGDIEAKFLASLDALALTPLKLDMVDFNNIDAFFFAESLLFIGPDFLPLFIDELDASVRSGSGVLTLDPILQPAESSGDDAVSSLSFGQFLSVSCSENQLVTPAQVEGWLAEIRPQFVPPIRASVESLLGYCAAWPYKQFGPEAFEPVYSSVRTLILAGGLDPRTPPSNAEIVETTLSQSYLAIFPGLSHSIQSSGNNCAQAIVSQFIFAGGDPLDSCSAEQTLDVYYPPK